MHSVYKQRSAGSLGECREANCNAMDYVLVQLTFTGEITVLCWGFALSHHGEVDLVP